MQDFALLNLLFVVRSWESRWTSVYFVYFKACSVRFVHSKVSFVYFACSKVSSVCLVYPLLKHCGNLFFGCFKQQLQLPKGPCGPLTTAGPKVKNRTRPKMQFRSTVNHRSQKTLNPKKARKVQHPTTPPTKNKKYIPSRKVSRKEAESLLWCKSPDSSQGPPTADDISPARAFGYQNIRNYGRESVAQRYPCICICMCVYIYTCIHKVTQDVWEFPKNPQHLTRSQKNSIPHIRTSLWDPQFTETAIYCWQGSSLNLPYINARPP